MNEFQKDILKGLEKFCKGKMEPFMEDDDEAGRFRMEIFQGLGRYGVAGVLVPEEFGGGGLSFHDYVLILREIAKYSVSYAVTLSVSSMVQSMIFQHGDQKQKERFLPPLAGGDHIGAFALTESGSGSDAASLMTSAKAASGGYVLNGSKMFISSAGIAKTYIVFARTGEKGPKGISAFIVEEGTPGFKLGKLEKKMGWKASPTRELIFENCFVPEEQRLSSEGQGFPIAMSALDKGRIAIGAIAVGLSERAAGEALKFALQRQQFGKSIFDFQGISFMLADMNTEIEASRLLVEEAARLYDEKTLSSKFSAMAKVKATDTAMMVTTNAVQILGGVGYTQEYPLERYMRDAKVLQIVEGTNQIQRVIIAKHLKEEFS